MRMLSLPALFCAYALTICGCKQADPEIEIDVESTVPQLEFSQPTQAPKFSPFDFGLAELDSKNDQLVVFYRPLFKATTKTRQETFTQIALDTVTQEVTDENGRKSTKVEQFERPEVRTREITFTVYELEADQFLRCPIGSLVVFDTKGSSSS